MLLTITLKGKQIVVDLIVFDMPDFNMVLGMDFLIRIGVKIDYRKKKVQFHLDDSEEFVSVCPKNHLRYQFQGISSCI